MSHDPARLPPYRASIAGTLLAAREAVMSRIRPILKSVNITEQQWRVLRVLAERETMDAVSIAEEALLHPPSVSRIVRELAARGLLERKTDDRDARRSELALTAAGRRLLDETMPRSLLVVNGINDTFGPERLRALMDEITLFSRSLDAADPARFQKPTSA